MTYQRNWRSIGKTLALLLTLVAAHAQGQVGPDSTWVRKSDNGMRCTFDPKAVNPQAGLGEARAKACSLIKEARRGGKACIHIDGVTERECRGVEGAAVWRPWLVQDSRSIKLEGRFAVVQSAGQEMRLALIKGPGECKNAVDPQVSPALSVFVLLTPKPGTDEPRFHYSMVQVAQDVFLTAAHCVADAPENSLFLARASSAAPLTCTVPVIDPPNFSSPFDPASVSDIAVCRTGKVPDPGFMETPEVDWAVFASLKGKSIVLAGAGPDDQLQSGNTVYGPANFPLLPVPDPPAWPTGWSHDKFMGRAVANTLCQAFASDEGGDSGGPVFDTLGPPGPRRLLGVIARVDYANKRTFFTPIAKRRVCDFLSGKGQLQLDCSKAGD